MIKTLIDIEKERFAKLGYDSVVSVEDIAIVDTERCVPLGNDTIIITGFVFDADTTCGENERVTIVSPSDSISDIASKVASFGAGRLKTMRDYMIVKRLNSVSLDDIAEGKLCAGTQSPLTINFVRISPKR